MLTGVKFVVHDEGAFTNRANACGVIEGIVEEDGSCITYRSLGDDVPHPWQVACLQGSEAKVFRERSQARDAHRLEEAQVDCVTEVPIGVEIRVADGDLLGYRRVLQGGTFPEDLLACRILQYRALYLI